MMSTAIQYDEAWTRRVEALYATSDMVAQRQAVLAGLAAQPGERIADLGAGPGMLAAALAETVGPDGAIQGIDISQPMVDLARRRCGAWPWTTFDLGDVTRLPFADGAFDAAVATQVYEYVVDVAAALAELKRILRPGGRALILDTDWDTALWQTHDLARQRAIMRAFEPHCAHPRLARQLPTLLHATGFAVTWTGVHTILNPHLHADSYSYGIIDFIAAYVAGQGGLDPDVVAAWRAELHALGAGGDYFFSINRYLFLVQKPVERYPA